MSKLDYDWIDDPFNEEKQAEELKRANDSKRVGCLIVAIVVVALFILLAVFACVGLYAFFPNA